MYDSTDEMLGLQAHGECTGDRFESIDPKTFSVAKFGHHRLTTYIQGSSTCQKIVVITAPQRTTLNMTIQYHAARLSRDTVQQHYANIP